MDSFTFFFLLDYQRFYERLIWLAVGKTVLWIYIF
jgi:hypothetical protein